MHGIAPYVRISKLSIIVVGRSAVQRSGGNLEE
jgi:hypothetical protein